MPHRSLALVLLVVFASLAGTLSAAEFTLKPQHDGGVTVLLDGKLFTEYWTRSGAKPVLWPVVGPGEVEMTRDFPMKFVQGEKHDHPHQRSLWFTYGNVNGVDFWTEFDAHGTIKHRKFLEPVFKDRKDSRKAADKAVIATVNDWLDASGKKLMEDERRITFSTQGTSRVIDFDITFKATEGPVTFGDTKEGAFSVRVPTWMDVDPEKGKTLEPGTEGHITNSNGITNAAAWGQKARWVDYTGKHDGQTLGIAILNHPSSFGYPTRWHVRGYGLFAANPWGVHEFDPKAEKSNYVLPANESLTLRYRVIFHAGDTKEADIASAFEKYAAEKH